MTSLRLTGRAYDSGVRRAGLYVVAGVGLLTAVVLAALGVGDRAGALSDWQALILGSVQGLTELLPISSSGHLILVPWAADWRYLEANPDFNKTFDVALHLGTLVAVVVYFWRDVVRYLKAWFGSVWRRAVSATDERIAWYIFAATVPAAIAGAAGEDFIEEKLGQPWQIAILLAAFGILLWIADRTPERMGIDDLRFKTAFVIGISQILALMPGVSRSGITITSGRFAGLDRDAAARFSFLLLIPIVAGAVIYKGVKHVVFGSLPPGSAGPFVVGTVAAASVGLVAIDVLLGYVRRHNYTPFVIYRLVVAGIVLTVIATGVRDATF
jgi:undecaprenyl-diphosphatase